VASAIGLCAGLHAQVVSLNQTFEGTTAPGWVFGGNGAYTPVLTANGGGDPVGSGWLELTNNNYNEATYAYDSTPFASANATITATFNLALFNSSGGTSADGITFFLANANVLPSQGGAGFSPGAYGGSLGYAQKTLAGGGGSDIDGMTGGYLGIGIDSYGNYSNPTEGRIGGTGFIPNAIAVRGPGSLLTGYNYLGGTNALSQPLSYPNLTTRPTGSEDETVQMVLTSTNQLTVSIEFGNSGVFVNEFTANLSGYTRPNQLIMGFTGGTGSDTQTEEVQGLTLTSITANLWTNANADSSWNTANDWYGTPSGIVPLAGSDVLLNNAYVSTAQTIAVGSNQVIRSLQIDAPFSYTLNGGSLEFNTEGNAGTSGIVVTQTNGTAAQTVNSNLQADNAIVIENNTTSALTLGGTLATGGNTVNFNGSGAVTENGVVSGTGSIYETGTGTSTLTAANTFSGGTQILSGTLDANNASALGTGAVSLYGGTLGSTNASSIANAVALEGNAALSGITSGGLLTQTGGSYTLVLSNATQSGNVALSNTGTAETLTAEVDSGTSTISGVISNGGTGAGGLTKTGAGTLVLGGVDTYTGTTTASAGTLQLGVNNAISSSSSVTLNNSTLNLAGYSDLVGNLAFTNGTIDFGTGNVTNTFVVNNITAGAGVLTIDDWTSGKTNLAAINSAVGASILNSIYFAGVGSGAIEQGSLSSVGNGEGSAYLIVPNNTFLTWSGLGTDNNWTTGADWVGGSAPSTTAGSTQKLDFTGTTRTSPVMNGSYSINALRFDASAGAFTISDNGFSLTLDGTVPSIIQESPSNETISGTGAVVFSTSGVIDVSGAGTLTIASALSGAGSISKLSAGTLALSGNNSGYSGPIGIEAGTVSVSGNQTPLGTGAATVSSGATLAITDGSTVANALSLTGTGVGGVGALDSNPGAATTATVTGLVTLGGATTINSNSGTLAMSGGITGSGSALTLTGAGNTNITAAIATGTAGVTMGGTGTATLSADNSYTGLTTVNSGTLDLSATGLTNVYSVNGNLTVNGGAVNISDSTTSVFQLNPSLTLTINGGTVSLLGSSKETISNFAGSAGTLSLGSSGYLTVSGTSPSSYGGLITGGGTFDKENTGELILSGANTGFTGSLIVNDGILSADSTNATGTATVTVGNSGNFEIQGGVTLASPFSLSTNGASTGNGAIENISGANTITGAVTLTANSRVQSDSGSLTLSNTVGLGANTLDVGGNANTNLNGVISGTGGLTKDGTGTALLGAVNTYTGATTVSGGTLQIGVTNAINSASSLTLTNGTIFLNGKSESVGTLTFTNGTINFGVPTSTNAFVFSSLASGSGILTIDDYTASTYLAVVTTNSNLTAILGDIYFAGVGSGATVQGTTTNTGDGTAYLIVPNTTFLDWDGAEQFHSQLWNYVHNGTTSNWSGAGAPVPSQTAGSTQKLDFTGSTGTTPTMDTNYSANAIEFDSAAGTSFTITQAGYTLTMDGAAPSIIDASSHAQTISGGTVDFASNGVIDVTGTGGLTISSALAGSGNITKLDNGTVTLTGNNGSYTGSFDVTGGVLAASTGTNVLGSGTVTVASGATVDLTSAVTITNPFILTGTGYSSAGALESQPGAAGTSILSGSIGLSGTTTINSVNGILELTGGLTGSSGALTITGAGTTEITGAGNYTGSTTVNQGTVDLDSTSGSSIDGDLTVSGGTVNDQASGQLSATTNLTVSSGTFALTGTSSETVQSLTGASPGAVTINSGTLTISGSGSTTYTGSISGGGGVTKAGSGTQILGGTNSYTGATNVNAGTLQLNSAITSTTVKVNGGTLLANAGSVFSTSANLTVATGAILSLNGTSQSILTLSNSGTLAFGTGGSLTLGGTGSSSLGGLLSGSGTLTLNTGSTLTLGASFDDPNLNIVLNGGSLYLAGMSDTFGSLSVTGSSIIDFASPSTSVLSVSGVTVSGTGTMLTVKDWSNTIDYFYSQTSPTAGALSSITFNGYAGPTKWESYTDGPGNGHEITPAPEPGAYGAIFVGISLASIMIYRRRRPSVPKRA
jgi:autotransporter-associated beta strand protein